MICMINRIWKITFSNWGKYNVTAPNIKRAIETIRKQRKGEYRNRIQDITEVELLAEDEV